jgi:hypothetical protein
MIRSQLRIGRNRFLTRWSWQAIKEIVGNNTKNHFAINLHMKTTVILFNVLGFLFLTNLAVSADQKLPDAEIKQKLLGYWQSPRHGYHIASDGIIYMCPRKDATTTNRWAVKDGKFYWDGAPHTIVTLNNSKFVYREIGGHGTSFTLIKGTKEEVDPD